MEEVVNQTKELIDRFTSTTVADVLEMQLKTLNAMVSDHKLDMIVGQLLIIRETCKLAEQL